jgi:hypothetical protein
MSKSHEEDLEMQEAQKLLDEEDARDGATHVKDDRFDADLDDLEATESLPAPASAQNATTAVRFAFVWGELRVEEEETREGPAGKGRRKGRLWCSGRAYWR